MQSFQTSYILRAPPAILLTVLLLQFYAEAATWQDFQNRHIAPPPGPNENLNTYCDRMMSARGMTQPKCKPRNAFIHDAPSIAQKVCRGQSTPKGGNLFDSILYFNLTDCQVTKGKAPPNCGYKGTCHHSRIRVGCTTGKKVSINDPIHFEAIIP
uniref:Ribonuclease pancreatic-like n=1 Tax=Pogona vitticeps TaxID=103695 RepID=A0ABM5GQ88_9SAUR